MGNTQKKQFIDKEIYQKSYGSNVPNETYPPSSIILKYLEFTQPPFPLARDAIYRWSLKLKDRG